jgi:hypothetical protein
MKAILLKRSALALLLLPLAFGLTAPAHAQQAAARAATPEEVNTYMAMSAINMCALAASKVAFKPAIDSSVSMVASVITDKHGGKIAGGPANLTRQQIINATVAESVLRVERICGKNLPADWRKEFDPVLAQVKKAMSAQTSKSPGKK